jgi:hypothetical protein
MFASEYSRADLERVHSLCLTVATLLGDEVCTNDIVVVGGVVPSLLFAGLESDPDLGAHVGTHDLDLALDIAILDERRYEAIRDLLIRGGFENDTKEDGTIVRQRWRSITTGAEVDFLITLDPPSGGGAGRLQNLTHDLAAIKMLGLDLAFAHKLMLPLEGHDLDGRRVARNLPVCRGEILVVLKSLAMGGRDKNKDAYDLFYVLQHLHGGVASAGTWLGGLSDHPALTRMASNLERDFRTIDDRGPRMVCSFLARDSDVDFAADVLASVQELLSAFHGTRSAEA